MFETDVNNAVKNGNLEEVIRILKAELAEDANNDKAAYDAFEQTRERNRIKYEKSGWQTNVFLTVVVAFVVLSTLWSMSIPPSDRPDAGFCSIQATGHPDNCR